MVKMLFSLLLVTAMTAAASANDFVAEGDSYSAKGEWDKAVTAWETAVTEDQNATLALTRIGGALLAQQRYSDSIDYFQQAISRDRDNHGAFIGLGISYLHMGRYDLSRAALQEARKLSSEKQEDIDKMLAWIDRKQSAAQLSQH